MSASPLPNEITGAVVDASLQIHRDLGPGLLESVYLRVLAWELSQRGFSVQAQKNVPFEYKAFLPVRPADRPPRE